MGSYNIFVAPIGGNNIDYWRRQNVECEMELRPVRSSMCIENQFAEIETYGTDETTVEKKYSTEAPTS